VRIPISSRAPALQSALYARYMTNYCLINSQETRLILGSVQKILGTLYTSLLQQHTVRVYNNARSAMRLRLYQLIRRYATGFLILEYSPIIPTL
jgi:deoxyribodipyrimidine photolyase-like uncharacterized protein